MKMSKKTGQALIFVCMAIIFLVILIAPLFNIVISERSMLDHERLEREAFYLAEGALEDTTTQFIRDVANFLIPADTARYPSSGAYPTNYAVSAAFPKGAQTSSVVNAAETNMRTIVENGITIGAKNYIVTSTCVHPANANIIVTLNRAITLRQTAAFQYAVFYNDTLEVLPGAPMTFSGSVHSNSDMYIASNGSTLTINSDYLHSAGNIYNKRLDKTGSDTGTVNILVDGTTNTFRNMHTSPPLDSDNTNWTTVSQDNVTGWNGTVKSSVHGVTKLAVPVVGSIAPDGYYAGNAGLTIIGTTIKRGIVTLAESGTPGHGIMPPGTIIITSTLSDAREGTAITTTNIDLQKLAGWVTDTKGNLVQSYDNNLPLNGLLYTTSSSNNTPVTHTAIRLINGSTIYSGNVYAGVDPITGHVMTNNSGGLAVVTNDPVYIQGDYNNRNTEKPSAVICDSVNILSNNWNDSNSSKALSSRVASDTTVDTAFIAGVDTTTPGNYNGGLENYPRLLENWSGKSLNITGCFTELWNTQAATGHWKDTGNYYNAPTRNWSFDSLFKNGHFPPFTPHAIEAQKNTWWKS